MEKDYTKLVKEVEALTKKLQEFFDIYYRTNFPDKQVMTKDLVMKDTNILVEGSVGLKIGSSASKLGVYGVAPVVQAGAISAPSGGTTVDTQSRAAIDSIRTAIKNYGITL